MPTARLLFDAAVDPDPFTAAGATPSRRPYGDAERSSDDHPG